MRQAAIFDTTNELLDKYAKKYDLTTDWQLAKHLGCTHATVRNYRLHKTKMDPTTCVQIAEAIRIDPMLVIAKIKMESNPTEREDTVWGKYAGRAFFLAAIISAAVAPYDTAYAQKSLNATDKIYIIRIRFALFCATLRKVFLRTWDLETFRCAGSRPHRPAHYSKCPFSSKAVAHT